MSKKLKNVFEYESPLVPNPFDTRIRRRNITRGIVEASTLSKHLDSLEDFASNAEEIGFDDVVYEPAKEPPVREKALPELIQAVGRQAVSPSRPLIEIPDVIPAMEIPEEILERARQNRERFNQQQGSDEGSASNLDHPALVGATAGTAAGVNSNFNQQNQQGTTEDQGISHPSILASQPVNPTSPWANVQTEPLSQQESAPVLNEEQASVVPTNVVTNDHNDSNGGNDDQGGQGFRG